MTRLGFVTISCTATLVGLIALFLLDEYYEVVIIGLSTTQGIVLILTCIAGIAAAIAIGSLFVIDLSERKADAEAQIGQAIDAYVAKLGETVGRIVSVQSVLDVITRELETTSRNLDMSNLNDELLNEVRSALSGLTGETTTKSYSIIWNSLPYSSRFDEFDTKLKSQYFDAIRSGDWRRVNARMKAL